MPKLGARLRCNRERCRFVIMEEGQGPQESPCVNKGEASSSLTDEGTI